MQLRDRTQGSGTDVHGTEGDQGREEVDPKVNMQVTPHPRGGLTAELTTSYGANICRAYSTPKGIWIPEQSIDLEHAHLIVVAVSMAIGWLTEQK